MISSHNPVGYRIIRLDEIDSTNSFLMRETQYLKEHGTIVIAQSQIGGRGRGNRKFVSFPGKNITFSIVIHPSLSLEELGIYSLLAGIAVVRTLQPHTTKPPRLKWPNDVLVGTRKICGILLETTRIPGISDPVLVMGIGINCLGTSADYPQELQKSLTTLQEESRHPVDQEAVFQEALMHLGRVLQELKIEGSSFLLNEWLSHSNSLGAAVRYETTDGWETGIIEGLTSKGYLLIRKDSGELWTHISGDVFYCEPAYGS